MCTTGYHKGLKVLFKNRDKQTETDEEILTDNGIIACRTKGDSYYSWGLNMFGCAFVSTAVNSPKWTSLIYENKLREAASLYEAENRALFIPTEVVSKTLPEVKTVRQWVDALTDTHRLSRGYNILVCDPQNAFHVEMYRDNISVRDVTQSLTVTNHFQSLKAGPAAEDDYPSSFRRLRYGNEHLPGVQSTPGILEMMKPSMPARQREIWRSAPFKTISSAVIDVTNGIVYYSRALEQEYLLFKIRYQNKL
ncbi:MAG: hypothetical protein HQK88_12770 [Nitrospirae bacterium]|nr:hypothetical protein [Nitrospirota bacterium]MBF0520504.1 hypothetical protein [Nitrospirota bacterium]MBF0535785.1 hypothetical protein [Nitrospirota bacterium]MBF0617674.1 hypothetical protein [Nitrospirota bacterium]